MTAAHPPGILLMLFMTSLRAWRELPRKLANHGLMMGIMLSLLLGAGQASGADWAKNFGGLGGANYWQQTSTFDTAGNLYVTGYFQDATLVLGNITLNRIGVYDAFVAKIDASGTVLWAKNFGGGGAGAFGESIAVDGTGNVYLTGDFTGGNLTTPALTKIGIHDAFALKLDASGNTTWSKNFGGSGADTSGQSITVDGTGNVYLGGYFSASNLTTPALTLIGSADAFSADAFALKLDSNGNTTWSKNYGGSGAAAYGTSIAVDGTGNVYLGGYFASANLTTPALTIIGSRDAFALKLDASGNTSWAKNFGGSGAWAQSRSIAVDGSGNVYLGGYFQGANLTTPALTKIGNTDILALKLDASGTTTTAKNVGGLTGGTALVAATAVDAAGNVYIAGTLDGTTLTLGGTTLTRIGVSDAFVAKINTSGAVVWAKNFGGSGANAFGQSITVDGTGNVYLGGTFFDGNLTTPTLTIIGSQDAFALKLDASGNTTWSRNYGGSGAGAVGSSIAVDGSGNVYLGGYFASANLTTPALTKIGGNDAFALKLDSSGNTTWSKNFGGSGATVINNSIAVDGTGNVYLGGYFGIANLTTPALTQIGNNDAFALKLDASGNTSWAKNFGGTWSTTYGNSIAVDGTGNVYLGGFFYGANLTTPALTQIGAQDAFALKLDASGTATWSRNFGGSGATVYGQSIAVDGSSNVYLGGYFASANLTTPALTIIGSRDAFALKLNASGNTTWSKNFGGGGATTNGLSIAVDGSSNVYLGGYFGGANLTTPALTKIGGNDALIIKQATVAVVAGPSPAPSTPAPSVPPLSPTIPGVGSQPSILNMGGGNGPSLIGDLTSILSGAVGSGLTHLNQSPSGTMVMGGFNGGNLAFVPLSFQTGDTRPNGVYAVGNGQYQIVSNGNVITVAPALVNLGQLAGLLPAGTSVTMAENGVLSATLNGIVYAVQPGILVQLLNASGSPQLVMGDDGYLHFTDSAGNSQVLYPAFLEMNTLTTYLRGLDLASTLSIQLDGTAIIRLNGNNYILVPDLGMGGVPQEHATDPWWQEAVNRFRFRNLQLFNSSQGFGVR